MAALIILRHGKSDWDAPHDDDRDRRLAGRGRRAARTMGRLLAAAGQVPDAVLCSPAVRAAETLQEAMEAGGWSCRVRTAPGLYSSDVDSVLDEIRAADAADLLMVVGHEPTSSELTALLMGGGRVRVPTAAAVRLNLDVGFADVVPGCAELAWLLVPRLFPKGSFPFAE